MIVDLCCRQHLQLGKRKLGMTAALKGIPMRASPRRQSAAICLAFVLCTSACSFAQPLLMSVESTPYDNQMARVQPVLASTPTEAPGWLSLSMINQSMRGLRRLRYRYSSQWQTPEEVRATRCADCKGKAIAMYEFMQSIGATNVRFVIGKHHAGDWFTHAWVEWETADGHFVLDPTFNARVVRAEQQNSSRYIPLYVYEGTLRYRAVNANLVAETPLHAVAADGENQFAASGAFVSDCRVR